MFLIQVFNVAHKTCISYVEEEKKRHVGYVHVHAQVSTTYAAFQREKQREQTIYVM